MDDLLKEFLTETAENLSVLDVSLVRLEQTPDEPELIRDIFRVMHTVKGPCGFLGLGRLEAVAHAGENVLGKLRDGELKATRETVSLVLECLDCIRAIVVGLEAEGAEPAGADTDLIARLNAYAEGGQIAPAAMPGLAVVPADEDSAEAASGTADDVSHDADLEVEMAVAPAVPAAATSLTVDAGEKKESAVAQQSVRVSVDLLETLMTMVSELVLTRNQVLQILRTQKDSDFATPLQRLNHVTSELQEAVMKTRMQPIGAAWSKLPRLVRDLAKELGKKIDLQMHGAETELDRQVLELIKDPLTHMVRNCADHGIEKPEQRRAAGKSDVGRITLNAFHQGGHIIIEIKDDGRGLPTDKIRAKVLQNGLATEAQLDAMSEKQIHQFIFKPGFSTAQQVTSVSGRGVGMDVVKTNLDRIGGSTEIRSVDGQGSTFTIKIPLTLAIVSALIVACGGERFAVPQISVLELVRVSQRSEYQIERIKGAPVLRLRKQLLPLISLRDILHLQGAAETSAGELAECFVIVVQVGTAVFGIMVDRVFDTEEIVVKPVAPILRDLSLFSGNTILGDGSVIMILDPNGLAGAVGQSGNHDSTAADIVTRSAGEEKTTLLLFRGADGAHRAVPLGLVARLEEIDRAKIERSASGLTVQYRGRLMPLVPVDMGFDPPVEGSQPVLVFADGDRSMGLMVEQIVDIVEEKLAVELLSTRPGCLGSAILGGRATDVIDTEYYLRQAFEDWLGPRPQMREGAAKRRVLLVDDSPFFRNLLTPLLSASGYQVTTVESADKALALHERGAMFDVILSDIEMPGTDGFAFADAVRRSQHWADKPLLALSASLPEDAAERGVFDSYVTKNDREGLLASLNEALHPLKGAA